MAEGAELPAFTRLVMGISRAIKDHILVTMGGVAVFVVLFMLFKRTKFGRRIWDKFKLKMPVIGPVVSKVAISRFSRTLGTLVSSGVPILQALTIVKDTAGNVIVGNVTVGENVRNSVVWAEDDHIAVAGVKNTVVVRANGHTLVMPTGQSEQLKALVQRL